MSDLINLPALIDDAKCLELSVIIGGLETRPVPPARVRQWCGMDVTVRNTNVGVTSAGPVGRVSTISPERSSQNTIDPCAFESCASTSWVEPVEPSDRQGAGSHTPSVRLLRDAEASFAQAPRGLAVRHPAYSAGCCINTSDVQVMTSQSREGLTAKAPQIELSGKIEADEVYVMAGHKGHPDTVRKKPSRPTQKAQRRARTRHA